MNTLDAAITNLCNVMVNSNDQMVNRRIDKAGYDRTLTGTVLEKSSKNADGSYDWTVVADGTTYGINSTMCDITAVGQKVRLYIPNHNYEKKYAEVIGGTANHPTKAVYAEKVSYQSSDEQDDDISYDSITETWTYPTGDSETRVYYLKIKARGTDDEEVIQIIFPDNSTMDLENFKTLM